jgi:hypothetical protein
LADLVTAQKTVTKATISTFKRKSNNMKEQRQTERPKKREFAAAAAGVWVSATLRREQLTDNDMGQNLQELEAGERPDWKNIADRNPMYKSY